MGTGTFASPCLFLKMPNNPPFLGFPMGKGMGRIAASAFFLAMSSKLNGVIHLSMGISPSLVESDANVYMDGVTLSALRLCGC